GRAPSPQEPDNRGNEALEGAAQTAAPRISFPQTSAERRLHRRFRLPVAEGDRRGRRSNTTNRRREQRMRQETLTSPGAASGACASAIATLQSRVKGSCSKCSRRWEPWRSRSGTQSDGLADSPTPNPSPRGGGGSVGACGFLPRRT